MAWGLPTPLPNPVEMFIYNSLPASPPPVVCQPPCQSKHARPLQTDPEHDFRKKRSLSPFLPPFHAQTPTLSSPPVLLSHCLSKSNALGENWVATGGEERKRERNGWIDEKKGRGRGLLHPAWAAKLVSEQQLDSRDAQHTLPTSCVCFCGV